MLPLRYRDYVDGDLEPENAIDGAAATEEEESDSQEAEDSWPAQLRLAKDRRSRTSILDKTAKQFLYRYEGTKDEEDSEEGSQMLSSESSSTEEEKVPRVRKPPKHLQDYV